MIRENQANIGNTSLSPSVVSLPREVLIMEVVMEDHSSQSLAGITMRLLVFNTRGTRSKTMSRR